MCLLDIRNNFVHQSLHCNTQRHKQYSLMKHTTNNNQQYKKYTMKIQQWRMFLLDNLNNYLNPQLNTCHRNMSYKNLRLLRNMFLQDRLYMKLILCMNTSQLGNLDNTMHRMWNIYQQNIGDIHWLLKKNKYHRDTLSTQ